MDFLFLFALVWKAGVLSVCLQDETKKYQVVSTKHAVSLVEPYQDNRICLLFSILIFDHTVIAYTGIGRGAAILYEITQHRVTQCGVLYFGIRLNYRIFNS